MTRKISIIGAGAVGATLAHRVLESGIADVVLVDIMKNMAVGKAYDLLDASSIMAHEASIIGTDDYKEIASSDIVVVTAGLARKPGMTREDLIAKNAQIVKGVLHQRLALGRRVAQDGLHVLLEAHVQHLVGLVKDGVAHLGEWRVWGLDQGFGGRV